MRKTFLYTLLLLIIITACNKDKFNNEGSYEAQFVSSVQYNGEIKEVLTDINVELRNETKNSIEFNEIVLDKNRKKIRGTLPTGILWNTEEVDIELKRDIFGNSISGTYTTNTLYLGDWRETTGTVEMIYN